MDGANGLGLIAASPLAAADGPGAERDAAGAEGGAGDGDEFQRFLWAILS